MGEFLSADDDLNLSDEPTHERLPVSGPETDNDQVAFDIPEFTPANFPEMNNDTDSLSTFHPKKSDSQCNLDKVSDETTIRHDSDSISKMSDTAATISTLKSSVTCWDYPEKSLASTYSALMLASKSMSRATYANPSMLRSTTD